MPENMNTWHSGWTQPKAPKSMSKPSVSSHSNKPCNNNSDKP